MRPVLGPALAMASVLLLCVSAADAADGIKASATATRLVPADIVVVTFQIGERAVPGEDAHAPDQQTILNKALQDQGLKVLEKSVRYDKLTPAFGTPAFNVISAAGSTRDPLEVQKQLSFRVTGFKRIDDVLDVLGRHGVRQNVTVGVAHSEQEKVREALQQEAVETAIARARTLATVAKVKAGAVVELSIQPTVGFGSQAMMTGGTLTFGMADQSLIDPKQPGELLQLKLSLTANVVLAVRSD